MIRRLPKKRKNRNPTCALNAKRSKHSDSATSVKTSTVLTAGNVLTRGSDQITLSTKLERRYGL
jgi:hypothetical protein